MMNLNLKFYTVVRKAMKYIHNFFENFLQLLLVGLHGFARTAWFAHDMYQCPCKILTVQNGV
jgi:hypothetical protein